MSLMMMLLMMSKKPYVPQSYTQTFTGSTNYPVPAGVTSLDLRGEGANGTPSSSTTVRRYKEVKVVYESFNYGGSFTTTRYPAVTKSGSTPSNYCGPMYDNGGGHFTQTCYEFTDASYTNTTPATTGASSTGFGKTFPGGTGGAPTPVTFNGVPVTPGTSYALVIPSGGFITVTYLK